jgi:hypothetical protein
MIRLHRGKKGSSMVASLGRFLRFPALELRSKVEKAPRSKVQVRFHKLKCLLG